MASNRKETNVVTGRRDTPTSCRRPRHTLNAMPASLPATNAPLMAVTSVKQAAPRATGVSFRR